MVLSPDRGGTALRQAVGEYLRAEEKCGKVSAGFTWFCRQPGYVGRRALGKKGFSVTTYSGCRLKCGKNRMQKPVCTRRERDAVG